MSTTAVTRTSQMTAEAALAEASRILHMRINDCGRTGEHDRRFWLEVDGFWWVVPCDAFRRPRAACAASDRLMGRPVSKAWLSRPEARHALGLLHRAADLHPLSSPSAVPVRRGGGAR